MKLFLIGLAFLIMAPAYSNEYKGYSMGPEQCSDIDIRDMASPEIKEHYSQPIDQGSVGWCYGYTASDLLSFETGKPLSPTHVSSIYNKDIRSNLFWKAGYNIFRMFMGREVYEGGFPGKAARVAMEASPICAYSPRDDYPRFIGVFEMIKERVKKKEISKEEACDLMEFALPSLDTKTTNFMEDFINNDLNDQLEGMIKQSCSPLINVPQRTVKTLTPPFFPTNNGKRKYADQLNDVLNQGKPLSVSYSVGHITDKVRGFHASTVIGRRWKNGRCEYNVKNTWGRVCSLYKANIECNQDDGSYWMKDEDFFDMSLNFTHL